MITFYLYAVDYGPDGIPRQTNSDLFFAEVRSFDEIYRQIEQNSPIEIQSQQKPPESIGKLIELQRQIMVATWKEVRVARPTVSSDSFKEIGAIRDSQQQAIQKLQDLRSRMTQAQLQPFFHDIEGNMERALKQLQKSLEAAIFQPLVAAVVAEQSSYQGLLKLRSKEHLLVQAQGTGNAPEQEEKTDLELKRNQDRYESEQAGTKKDESNINREALAILDRLKEIVRRQEGINQQTRDLEAQSRQAKTETERADVERQLKRLREEQQQLLHDADELRSKLNQSMQQETVNSTRERLEQTRQRMVDTVEKLREGQISQALNSGTRTERELKQISEDFRKQTAAQFAEALRELRDNSRGLVDREKQLGEQLNQLGDSLRPTLRATQGLAQLEVQFHQQQQQLNDVLERIKRVVEQAESSEPLLAKQLYDILRSTREMQLEEAINATQKHLKQGTIPEAVRTEAHVQAGINRLKGGIEKAAESVLGNEVDSLKRARRELAELSQLIHREIQSQGQTDTISSESKESSTSIVGGSKSAKATDDDKSPVQSNRASDAGSTAETQNQNALTASNSSLDLPNNAMPGDSGDAGPSSKRTSDGNFTAEKSKQAGLRSKKSPGRTAPSPGQEGKRGDDSGDGGTSGNEQGGGPLTGGNYSEFNERLRDIESMVSEPQLQAEVQKVRDRARQVRAEFKRHSNSPNWDLVKSSVHQPMLELQMRLSEEIAKRESPDSLVPVDRDPVPSRYRGLVRLYYERLGAGKDE